MKNEKNALVIGCGNIGAIYDLENDSILTHAKALFLTNLFNLFFYDTNPVLSKKIANKYEGVRVSDITEQLLNSVDWISICSPTDTHFFYLERFSELKNKLILCEKPVSYKSEEIDKLKVLYKKNPLTIYVNYIRRFQPAYINIKKIYSDVLKLHKLRECIIDYCRGFLNNASHAFDTLEFLFDSPIQLENISILKAEHDVFINDPTVSLTPKWENADIIVNGHTGISNTIFQIKLIFDSHLIEFLNSGNDILVYNKTNKKAPVFYKSNCVKNYMYHVVSYFMNSKNVSDTSNFVSSLDLNRKLLNYIGT